MDQFCQKNAADNLYFGVALRSGGRKKEHITQIPAVWCDIDYKDTPREKFITLSKAFPFRPSVIVFTGGGIHIYRILSEPADASDIPAVESINRKITHALGGDLNACDASRILRIPDTVNQKPERGGAVCKVESVNDFTCDLSDFDDLPEPKSSGDDAPEQAPAESPAALKNKRLSKIMECEFMRHCQADAAKLSEPEWYAMLSQLARETGGPDLIHQLSKAHQKYSAKETNGKIIHAVNAAGPRTCRQINTMWKCGENCGMKSPVALAHVPDKPETLDAEIGRLNEQFAVVMAGGKCLIMQSTLDPAHDNRPDVVFTTIADFKNYHANKFATDQQGKRVNIAKAWFTSEKRREYKGVVFDPSGTSDGFYNFWQGFGVKPRQGSWKHYREHIHRIICGGDDELFKWVVAWLARLVKYPGGKRPGTAIVLCGKKGTGKDTFVKYAGELFGRHYLPIVNSSQLVGKFNQHLKDALLVYCNEAVYAGDKAANSALKSLITDDYIFVEPKG